GKASRVITGFVSLDTIPLEPFYQQARQNGTVDASEWDEGMLLLGLQAAAWRIPFLPTRAGLGSDVPLDMPDLRAVRSPYMTVAKGADGVVHEEFEELLAVPALELDVALVHQHRADRSGNAMWLGEDPFFDDLMVRAANKAFVSAEQIVPTEDLDELA